MNRTHQSQPAQVCDFAIPKGSSSAAVLVAHSVAQSGDVGTTPSDRPSRRRAALARLRIMVLRPDQA